MAGNSKRPKRYFPFAEGPRNCVGQSLAKVSLVATAATLLQHFTFKLADEVSADSALPWWHHLRYLMQAHGCIDCSVCQANCHFQSQVLHTQCSSMAQPVAPLRICPGCGPVHLSI